MASVAVIRRSCRWAVCLLAVAMAMALAATETAPAPVARDSTSASPGSRIAPPTDRVEVPALRSSFFLGIVSLTPGLFERRGSLYQATYRARVLGFFYREHGSVEIEMDEAKLVRLAAGERVSFEGRATANDGGKRRITGEARPADATSGRIVLRIGVTKTLELSFEGPYCFLPADPPAKQP